MLSNQKLKKVFLLHIVLLIATFREESSAKPPNQDCPTLCGDLTIQKPFGIGPDCSENEYFEITCQASSNPKPVLTKFNMELLNYSSYGYFGSLKVNMPVAKACGDATSWVSLNLSGSPFYIDDSNVFGSVGCHGFAAMYNETGGLIDWCTSTCDAPNREPTMSSCSGYTCCQLAIPNKYLKLQTLGIKVSVRKEGSCRSGFMTMPMQELLNSKSIAHPVLVALQLSWPLILGEESGRHFSPSIDLEDYDPDFSPMNGLVFIIALGLLLVLCACFWSYWFYKIKEERKAAKLRTKYFNGRLEQSSSVHVTKLFTEKELKMATHNFNRVRIIRGGGQGTVYKGMLPNGQIVAVKRSQTFEESQWKQFINEVILLSQMNHKNVVKLLGCCLETKVPLLVYEFIPNRTLSQHIHNTQSELVPMWNMRIKIASETAKAIAHLHSSRPNPIYYKDINSNNILLDEKFRAKVSDFVVFKDIPKYQTHLTTCVRGTFDYLDPEYLRSSQFLNKSDVYSFGVILIELLTRQYPIRVTASDEEEWSLVDYFKKAMNESALDNILDPMILEGSTKEDVMLVANLANQCLNSRCIDRPTMEDVVMELEGLMKKLFLIKKP